MTSHSNGNAIFLTEKEADRIRSTVKDRLKNCSKSTGHARKSRDSKSAISQATGASLMADMGGIPDPDMTEMNSSRGTLPAIAVGEPYAPAVIPLQHLQPMDIADLQMNTHHRGRRITVKRVSPVVSFAARSWTMVQGESGDQTERLEICLHKSRYGEEVLESATIFCVKEPYFTLTDQGEYTIRIDHPSDLVIYHSEILNGGPGSASGMSNGESTGSTDDMAAVEKLAKACKDKGNVALGERRLYLAYARYTEGLNFARQHAVFIGNPSLARDISRNRAHVNLLLNQLEEAKQDAISSLIGDKDPKSILLDSKANFRAGRAAYGLGEYQEAKRYFQEQQLLTPDDKDASAYLRKISMRLHEQNTGLFDWTMIKIALSQSHPRVDVANFLHGTKIGESPGRGRGLFATRDIPAGDIVMCEKAFCVVWGHESQALAAMTYDIRDDKIRMSPVGLTVSVVHKLLNNPSLIDQVMDLYGDYRGDGHGVYRTEDGPIVDTFRIHDIVSRNAFGPGNQYGQDTETKSSAGLWIRAAYINHSCIPNLNREFVGDVMVIRAARSITANEELLNCYESSDFDTRSTTLMNTWGFECDCALCIAEKADDPVVRKKRKELVKEADAFVEREHWVGAKRLVIARAKRIEKAIDDTYDEKRYEGVPRMATVRIRGWLAQAGLRK